MFRDRRHWPSSYVGVAASSGWFVANRLSLDERRVLPGAAAACGHSDTPVGSLATLSSECDADADSWFLATVSHDGVEAAGD